MTLNQTLKSSTGFTLIEVIVAGALLAGVSLAAVKIFSEQKMAQRRVELDRILDNHISSLKSILNVKANCDATLQTGSVVNCTPVPGPAFVEPCSKAKNNFAVMNSAKSDFPSTLTSLKMRKSNTQVEDVIAVGSYISASQTHRLTGIQVVAPLNSSNVMGTGIARLNLTYNIPQMNSNVVRSIFLPVKVTGSKGSSDTYECMDDKMGVDKTLQKEGCEAIALLGDYDYDLQDCKSRDVKYDSSATPIFRCLEGETMVGMDNQGRAICQEADARLIPSQAVGPETTGCFGKQARIVKNASNQLVIECF